MQLHPDWLLQLLRPTARPLLGLQAVPKQLGKFPFKRPLVCQLVTVRRLPPILTQRPVWYLTRFITFTCALSAVPTSNLLGSVQLISGLCAASLPCHSLKVSKQLKGQFLVGQEISRRVPHQVGSTSASRLVRLRPTKHLLWPTLLPCVFLFTVLNQAPLA